MAKDEKMTQFPLEKVLTVCARDYCDSQSKKLSDYEMVGVDCTGNMLQFLNDIPPKAEVVVAYAFSDVFTPYNTYCHYAATALIPKKKSRKK